MSQQQQPDHPGGPGRGSPPHPGPPRVPTAFGGAPSARAPSRSPYRRKRRPGAGSGCGSALLIVAVMALAIGGIVAAALYVRDKDPDRRRDDRASDLAAVCRGKGIDSVPAYRKGAPDQLGGRYDPYARDGVPVAFHLVPGQADDVAESLTEVRLLGCSTTIATESTDCSFTRMGQRVTARWTTETSTELKIVDVHSAKVLKTVTLPTSRPCPAALRVEDDGRYTPTLPYDEINEQVEGQLSLYHQS